MKRKGAFRPPPVRLATVNAVSVRSWLLGQSMPRKRLEVQATCGKRERGLSAPNPVPVHPAVMPSSRIMSASSFCEGGLPCVSVYSVIRSPSEAFVFFVGPPPAPPRGFPIT